MADSGYSDSSNDATEKRPAASFHGPTTTAAAGNACSAARWCYGHGLPKSEPHGKHHSSTSTTIAGNKERAHGARLPRQSSSTHASAATADRSIRESTTPSCYGTGSGSSSTPTTANATTAAAATTRNCHATCSITVE
jgi:hypothetical protein